LRFSRVQWPFQFCRSVHLRAASSILNCTLRASLMRILILSDIHANFTALEAALAKAVELGRGCLPWRHCGLRPRSGGSQRKNSQPGAILHPRQSRQGCHRNHGQRRTSIPLPKPRLTGRESIVAGTFAMAGRTATRPPGNQRHRVGTWRVSG